MCSYLSFATASAWNTNYGYEDLLRALHVGMCVLLSDSAGQAFQTDGICLHSRSVHFMSHLADFISLSSSWRVANSLHLRSGGFGNTDQSFQVVKGSDDQEWSKL